MTTSQFKLAGRAVFGCATVLLFGLLITGCSTPRKTAEEPVATTTVTIQPSAPASEKDESLEIRKIASVKEASLGASSSGRSR